jgi:hypothetical protein
MAYSIDDRNTNSVDNRNSRLVQGGLTDRYNKRLGWWEKRTFEKRDDDLIITVREQEAGRPDLISYRLYGKAIYAWLVLQYNNIADPVTELTTGAEIVMPTKQRLALDIMTKTEGGNIIK